MASDSMTSPQSSESSWWTPQQNKLFEKALVQFQTDTPDRWHNVAEAVGGGKCVEDVKLHYQNLLNDLWLIENDRFPVPNYWSTTGTGDCKATEQQQSKKKKKKKQN